MAGRLPTLIIDLGSIFAVLSAWRERGKLRDARDIARRFVEEPDRWLSQLGATGRDRFPNDLQSHRSFPDRRVLVPRGWESTDAARDLQPRHGVPNSQRFDALRVLEEHGFIVSESKSSGGLHLAAEIVGMAASVGMPETLVIATGDPSIEPIVRTVRASGVRTGFVLFGTAAESAQLAKITDRFLDLSELVVSAFGLSLIGGFKVIDSVEGDLRRLVAAQLADDNQAEKRPAFLPFDELRTELELRITAEIVRAELPRHADGLAVLLGQWFGTAREVAAEDEEDSQGFDAIQLRWVHTPRGLVMTDAIAEIAQAVDTELKKTRGVAALSVVGPWTLAAIKKCAPEYEDDKYKYLGTEKLADFLRVLDGHMRRTAADWVPWDQWDTGTSSFLVREGATISEKGQTAPAGSPLQAIADLVARTLDEWGGEVTLVELANRISADPNLDANRENGWRNHGSFLRLLRAAESASPEFESRWEYLTTVAPGSLRAVGGSQMVESPRERAIGLVRTVTAGFPRDDRTTLARRSAALVTVFASIPTVGIFCDLLAGITTRARDLGVEVGIPGGREGYEFLIKTARLVDVPFGSSRYTPAGFRGNLVVIADRLFARSGLPATQSVDPVPSGLTGHQPTAHEMLRIVADSYDRYLVERGRGPEYVQAARLLLEPGYDQDGPLRPVALDPDVVRAEMQTWVDGLGQAAIIERDGGSIELHLSQMLDDLCEDRRRFMQSVVGGSGTDQHGVLDYVKLGMSAANEVARFLKSEAIGGSLHEVADRYDRWASGQGLPRIGYAPFAVAIASLARADAALSGRLETAVAPGWLWADAADRLPNSARAIVHAGTRGLAEAYLRKGQPVSWVDVAAALVSRKPADLS